jgi:hypothetical protein
MSEAVIKEVESKKQPLMNEIRRIEEEFKSMLREYERTSSFN